MTEGPSGEDPEEREDHEDREGRLHPLSPASLTVAAVLGLVGGWLLHPVAVRLTRAAPGVSGLRGRVVR